MAQCGCRADDGDVAARLARSSGRAEDQAEAGIVHDVDSVEVHNEGRGIVVVGRTSGGSHEQWKKNGKVLTIATHTKELKPYQIKQIGKALEE